MNAKYLVVSVLSIAASVVTSDTNADEYSHPQLSPSYSVMGGSGLIQMPVGRMNEEGAFTVGYNMSSDYRFFTTSLQLFPWLETNIRYTLIPSFPRDTGGLYSDKGIDVKLRLLEESEYLPELSVGMRDIGGTGLFDGEYLAASKRFGAFDVTAGLGWGYLGQYNDFGRDNTDGQCGRDQGTEGSGGIVDYSRWFTGCMAIFGGVEYQSPYQPLRFKLEYDGNDYSYDFPVRRTAIDMTPDSRINAAVHYRPIEWVDLRLAFERGNTVSVGFNLSTNLSQMRPVVINEPMPVYAREAGQSIDYDQLASQLSEFSGYQVRSLAMHQNELVVRASQTKYRNRDEAVARASTVIANNVGDASHYRIIELGNRMSLAEYHVNADEYQQVATYQYPEAHVSDAATRQDVGEQPEVWSWRSTSDTAYGWNVDLDQSFGGVEGFYMYTFGIDLVGVHWFNESTKLGATGYLNLIDNFDKFVYSVPPDGTGDKVMRVRTLVRQYVEENRLAVKSLYGAKFFEFAPSHYAVAYGGYLETMFGGAGAEYLYRPLDSNWAFGLDLNYVAQRDPFNPWRFMDDKEYTDEFGNPYRVQAGGLTGHATLYYEPNIEFLGDSLFTVSAGQYLAGDRGVTVDYSRQFDSGVIVGAFATKTNLSAEEFGEGSFSKGFYISIPFDLMKPESTVRRLSFSWLPLTRDGGSRLGRPESLYRSTDSRAPWYGRASE